MTETIQKIIDQGIDKILSAYPQLLPILTLIDTHKGKPLLVGGAVRDILVKNTPLDIDIEVYGLSLEQLEAVLKNFGHLRLVGKSFGVLRIDGLDIDWSIPRSDSVGRHPNVTLAPNLPFEKAFARRDLTINAMGIELLKHTLIDPFGGINDLAKKVLRSPNPALFVEDPLRFFRVMQFTARFAMKPDKELNTLCSSMDLHGVSKERIAAEFDKLFLLSKRPSLAFRWLNDIGKLQPIYPHLAATQGVPQDPQWHPEGDVWQHTLQALDAAAYQDYKDDEERLLIVYAALCHDLGKVSTTKFENGRWRSHGHDIAGQPLAKEFLFQISVRKELITTASLLVRYHMAPGQFVKTKASSAAYKRLATKLAPHTNLEQLSYVAYADDRGKSADANSFMTLPVPRIEEFIHKAKEVGVFTKPLEPLLIGRDLLKFMEPGPQVGILLAQAYHLQINEGITDKNLLLKKIKIIG